jgi:hypothetical protein
MSSKKGSSYKMLSEKRDTPPPPGEGLAKLTPSFNIYLPGA